jgi:hypothetical protein
LATRILLVTPAMARVGERLALHGDEAPGVSLWVEGELQHAVGVVVVEFAVSDGILDLVVALATRAHHELADTAFGVRPPARVLRCETLVVVLVAGEDYVSPCLVEGLPERPYLGGAAVYLPGTEARVVHVGQGAGFVLVGCEVGLEPSDLWRAN